MGNKTVTVKLTDSEDNMFCPLHVCLDSYQSSESLTEGDIVKIETHHQNIEFRYDGEKLIEQSSKIKEEFGL